MHVDRSLKIELRPSEDNGWDWFILCEGENGFYPSGEQGWTPDFITACRTANLTAIEMTAIINGSSRLAAHINESRRRGEKYE